MSQAARIVIGLLVAALIFVTVCPIGYRPISDLPVWVERSGAFALTGLLFATAFPRHRWHVLVLIVAAAGGLEAMQMLQPSRHAVMADFVEKALGGAFGVLAVMAMDYLQSLVRTRLWIPSAPALHR